MFFFRDTAGGTVFVLVPHHSVWGGTPYVSSAPTQGHPSPGRSASSSLCFGERACGGAVSSESDIRVPEAKRGRVPL